MTRVLSFATSGKVDARNGEGGAPRVVFAGPLPKPLHGMAVMNAHITALIEAQIPIYRLPIRPDPGLTGVRRHLSKARSALAAIGGLVPARRNGGRVLYASVDHRLGGLWTTMLALTGRLMGFRIFLHHHSYYYVDRKTRIMAALVGVAGPDAVHVVLCDEMAQDMKRLYPGVCRTLTSLNTVEQPAPLHRSLGSARIPLRLGMLSNLTFEKGLVEFVELVEWAVGADIDVQGVLAGPAGNAERSFIEMKLAALGDRLEWRGYVASENRSQFYRDIDLFIFPTKNESFGLVLLEALVCGVPVIAPKRGCVCTFASLEAATIVPLDRDFMEAAREQIRCFSADPMLVRSLARKAVDEGREMNARHAKSQGALVKALIAAAGDHT